MALESPALAQIKCLCESRQKMLVVPLNWASMVDSLSSFFWQSSNESWSWRSRPLASVLSHESPSILLLATESFEPFR